MARNKEHSILRSLTRYELEEEDDYMDLEDAYDDQWREEAQRYPRGRGAGVTKLIEVED